MAHKDTVRIHWVKRHREPAPDVHHEWIVVVEPTRVKCAVEWGKGWECLLLLMLLLVRIVP